VRLRGEVDDNLRRGGDEMTGDLTDDQIALLCDIGEFDPSKRTEEKKRDLDRLVSGGYVEPAGNRPAFKLTAKGVQFLGERGAGLNEA
jgi:hypothetical protein